MKTWKVAIIGCGNFTGGQYLPDIHKIRGAELVAVCDIIPERAQAYAARAGISQWYTSIWKNAILIFSWMPPASRLITRSTCKPF